MKFREPTRPSPSNRDRRGITRACAHSGGVPEMPTQGFLTQEQISKLQAAELLGVSAPRISQRLQTGHLSDEAC